MGSGCPDLSGGTRIAYSISGSPWEKESMEKSVVVCNAFPDDNKGGCAITQQTIEWLKGVFPGHPVYIVPVEQRGTHDARRYRFTLERHPESRILRSPIHTDGSFRTTSSMLLRSFRLLWGRPGNSAFERTMSTAQVVVSKGGYLFVERETLRGLLGLWFTAFPLILCHAEEGADRGPVHVGGPISASGIQDPVSMDPAAR